MIQALRNLVDLFTFYFDVLARMLDKLLDLLCECICQGRLWAGFTFLLPQR
jgi:brefeldin A-inhibited guanine nucleotide-exchange protein